MFTNNVSIKLFAYDIKIYIEIRDPCQAVDLQRLYQLHCQLGSQMATKIFNKQVSSYAITLRNSSSPSVYLLDGVILPTVPSCIDLGVYMDSALSFFFVSC